MGRKMNEYETMVVREIELAGGRVLRKGVDGQSHRTLTFSIGSKELTYHYPSSGHTNGCALKNARAGLRRLIKTMVEPQPTDTDAKQGDTDMLLSQAIDQATPHMTTKQLRRKIVDRYLEQDCIVNDIVEEFGLFYDEVVKHLKLGGPRSARKVKEEITLRVQTEKVFTARLTGKKAQPGKRLKKVLDSLVEQETAEPVEQEEEIMIEAKPAIKPGRGSKAWRSDINAAFEEKLADATIIQSDGLFQIDLYCHGCGEAHEGAYLSETVDAPYKVIQTLRKAGWKIGDRTRQHFCSKHTQPEEPGEASTAMVPAAGNLVSSVTVLAPIERTPAALRAARRAVIDWLDQSYDLSRHGYREGMSDEKIAAEVGLTVAEVVSIREDLFGPLGPPVELTELLLKAEALDDRIKALSEDFTRQRDALLKEAKDLRSEFSEKISRLGYVE